MQRKYPIGLQSFRKIRDNDYIYVDKTEAIYRLISTGKYYFISRPRHFGKSLLVDTLNQPSLHTISQSTPAARPSE